MKAVLEENKAHILDIWDKVEAKIAVTSDKIRDGMPYTIRNGVYDDWQDYASWWTNTFWAGILWLLYKETKIEKYKAYAQSIEVKMDSVLHDYDELHHDVGFMWLLSSVMSYELTGDAGSRKRAMLAASVLSSRSNIAGGYIRAWNGDHTGWAIIDCMMNLPLLYWAGEQCGDDRFKHVGMMHADKTMRDFVREDGSVHHIVIYDESNGNVLETPRGQGYEAGSSWSRGQSWALYGFAQSYSWTKKPDYLHTAKKVAHYVIACLAQRGYVPPCDYRQPADSGLLDSSAGAIAMCGLLEIAKAVPEAEKGIYIRAAVDILKALNENCANWSHSSEAILTYGTASFHRDGDKRSVVVNNALIYGDYYFVEAVCKLKELLR